MGAVRAVFTLGFVDKGRYFVMVRAYAVGARGQRDLVAPAPSLGEFTIRVGDGGKRSKN
jgi:hypothetical protein